MKEKVKDQYNANKSSLDQFNNNLQNKFSENVPSTDKSINKISANKITGVDNERNLRNMRSPMDIFNDITSNKCESIKNLRKQNSANVSLKSDISNKYR